MNQRLPIGEFVRPQAFSTSLCQQYALELDTLGTQIREITDSFSDALWQQTYRRGAWPAWKIVHHLFDSQLQGYCRFKFALTESEPVIKPYDQDAWSDLPDSSIQTLTETISLIELLHQRWARLCSGLSENQWKRVFLHPEGGTFALFEAIALYAWHARHHLAHLKIIASA